MAKKRSTCGPCVSKKCKVPLWKEDLLYTGHSQVPIDDSEVLGSCCCEMPPPEPLPDCCNFCSSCPKPKPKVSFNVFGPTKSLKCGYSKYKKKLCKQSGGFCSVM